MANPLAGVIAWVSSHAVLAIAGVAGAGVVVMASRSASQRTAMPAVSGTPLAPGAAVDVAGLIGQGAGLALQGAGLGLPLVQGGIDLAGAAVSGLAGAVSVLAGSQADTAATIGGVATTLVAAAVTPIYQAPALAPAPAPTYQAPAPAPAPPPAPTAVGYRVIIEGAGTINAYIVSNTCGLSARTLSFPGPSSAAVARGTCNGRVYWTSLGSGGYSGASYVAGLSGGPWRVVREMSDGSRVPIGQSGS